MRHAVTHQPLDFKPRVRTAPTPSAVRARRGRRCPAFRSTLPGMRVVLLYPPPWKLTDVGEAEPWGGDGPPTAYRPGDLDPDFHQIPYGLLSLGAQAVRAGHQVKIFNLSAFTWTRVEEVLGALDADVYGMSCWTANRRGVDL